MGSMQKLKTDNLNSHQAVSCETRTDAEPLFFEKLEPRILLSADAAAGLVTIDHFNEQNDASLDVSESIRLILDSYPGEDQLSQAANDTSAAYPSFVLDELGEALGLTGSQTDTSSDDSAATLGDLLSTNDTESRQEIIFIDAATPDYEILLDGITAQSDVSYQIHLLQNDRAGIDQISEVLAQYQDIEAIHIISHGNGEGLQLGNSWFGTDSLESYSEQLQAWQDVLDENADILIYGCELASTIEGQALVDALAGLTGADVAASDDLTGAAQLGGDWELEHQTGSIETDLAIGEVTQSQWNNVLGVTHIDQAVSTEEVFVKDGQSYSQSFTYTSGSGTYLVDAIGLEIVELAGTDSVLTVTLSDALTGGTELGSDSINLGTNNNDAYWYYFNFGEVTLTDGVQYFINVTTDSPDSNIALRSDGGGSFAGGDRYLNGVSEPGKDLAFKVIDKSTITVDLRAIVDGGDGGFIDEAVNGNVSSIDQLITTPGANGISLREAIQAANNEAGLDEIIITAGTYTLATDGNGENANVSGDLDITQEVVIRGDSANTTHIEGNLNSTRAFDVRTAGVEISDISIDNGTAINGGGLRVANGPGEIGDPGAIVYGVILNNVEFNLNTADDGGALFVNEGLARLNSVTFDSNSAALNGGAFVNEDGVVYINGSTFVNNEVNNPANTATTGGAIRNISDEMYITDSLFTGNRAIAADSIPFDQFAEGGAIYNEGMLSVTRTTFSGNEAEFGAGIYNDVGYNQPFDFYTASILNLDSVLFAGNIAHFGTGGGLQNDGSVANLTNVTFSGNQGLLGSAAIRNYSAIDIVSADDIPIAILNINHSTFDGNVDYLDPALGSGISQTSFVADTLQNAQLNITNSILNDGDSNVSGGVITSAEYNIDSDGTASFVSITNKTGDPLLEPLNDNGGITKTHSLKEGSIAINAADPASTLSMDQRGQIRIGEADIGAFEFTDYGLVWGETGAVAGADSIKVSTLSGQHVTTLVSGLDNPVSVAIDPGAGRVYWASPNTDSIMSANLDGSDSKTIISAIGMLATDTIAIDLDLTAGKIYWATSAGGGSLDSANLDGTGISSIVGSVKTPTGLALDVPNDKVYWIDDGTTDVIKTTSLTGAGTGNYLSTNVDATADIAIDAVNRHIYWSNNLGAVDLPDLPDYYILRDSMDTPGSMEMVTVAGQVAGLAVDTNNNRLYWTDPTSNELYSIDLTTFVDGADLSATPALLATDVNTVQDVDTFTIASVTGINQPPVLNNNSLTLTQGETVNLTAANFSADDLGTANPLLVFNVSAVQNGYFSYDAAPTVAINSFSQAEVSAGIVNFVHDGGELAPYYEVSVSDGVDSSTAQAATINFTGSEQGVVWLSTKADAGAGSGINGVDTIALDNDDILQMADSSFQLGTTTNGTFSVAFDASNPDFTSDNPNINGMHYVTDDVSFGGFNTINLQAGDLILTSDHGANATFNSNGAIPPASASITVSKDDIFFFRPDTPGDYSTGNFYILLNDALGVGNSIDALTLVEKKTDVGGTTLEKGDLLLASNQYGNDNVWWLSTATLDTTIPATIPHRRRCWTLLMLVSRLVIT